MLQFVSNQVGDFPDLFEDQMTSASSLQNAGVGATPQHPAQTPLTPQTLAAGTYQSSGVRLAPSQTLSPQSMPLTPPLTPAQTPSPTAASSSQPLQVTRNPPLLQPRPQLVQPIQPQLQQAAQTAIQVSASFTVLTTSHSFCPRPT